MPVHGDEIIARDMPLRFCEPTPSIQRLMPQSFLDWNDKSRRDSARINAEKAPKPCFIRVTGHINGAFKRFLATGSPEKRVICP
jgi:hypothetical protein